MRNIFLIFLACSFVLSSCKKKDKAKEMAQSVTANNFLSDTKYSFLTVEIVYEPGVPPAPETITAIQNFLNARCNKSAGINVTFREIPSQGKNYLSINDIVKIENDTRKNYPEGDEITAFVYLANADYTGNSGNFKTLGVQYGASSIALFGKTMKSYSGGLAQPPYKTLETSVALHEFGHLLGLVNSGTGMVHYHEGGPQGHHCSNKNCLMYYAVETSDIVTNILGGNVPELDTDCLNDLKANGGK